jgi:multidrug efflux pump subunit AcrA (membrane-fusion protein)
MKKKRTWIIIGISAVLLAAGGVYLATRSANGQAANQLLANMQTAKVIRTTLANSVESSGSVTSKAKAQLSFGTSGTVEQVKVAVGDRVKQGDVLAVLASTDLQSKVTQAEQTYLLQQLTYSNTMEADPSQIAVAQAAYNSALAAYNAARQDYSSLADKQAVQCSQLTTARANLDRAQTAYDRIANDHQAKKYLNADWGLSTGGQV